MSPSSHEMPITRSQLIALIFMLAAIPIVLNLHLLPALFAGLLVHELVHLLAPRLFGTQSIGRAKLLALSLLLIAIITAIALTITYLVIFLRSDSGSVSVLLEKMAEILEKARQTMPANIQALIPIDSSALKDLIVKSLRDNANELKSMGGELGHGLLNALIGMILGGLISLRQTPSNAVPKPLVQALTQSTGRLSQAFHRVVFAQVRISFLNTVLSGIYLAIVLPFFDVHLPLVKTMIVLAFLAGLLPVIGNLISNTGMVIISLSVSPTAALVSLSFLVIIHKLEYFINARIVGSQIHASAWELLLAMLFMEACFGLPGVIAAPVFYAYLKAEFSDHDWI